MLNVKQSDRISISLKVKIDLNGNTYYSVSSKGHRIRHGRDVELSDFQNRTDALQKFLNKMSWNFDGIWIEGKFSDMEFIYTYTKEN